MTPETTGTAQSPADVTPPTEKLRFILLGFGHDMGFRVFEFEGIAADRTRTAFTVSTDMALARRYGIPLQELPLLCRAILERRDGADKRAFIYTEEEMRVHADDLAAIRRAAALKRRSYHKPPTSSPGAAWRVPPG
jgi:hypothetical protein